MWRLVAVVTAGLAGGVFGFYGGPAALLAFAIATDTGPASQAYSALVAAALAAAVAGVIFGAGLPADVRAGRPFWRRAMPAVLTLGSPLLGVVTSAAVIFGSLFFMQYVTVVPDAVYVA